MVANRALDTSAADPAALPWLYEASSVVADPLVRNFATIGGNLAHADPANDHPAMMLALRAQVVAARPSGQRMIAHRRLPGGHVGDRARRPRKSSTEIHSPAPGASDTGSAYVKFERKVGDYAIAAVGAQLTLDGDICTQAGIGLTNVGPKAIRATQAEAFLVGKRHDEETVQRGGAAGRRRRRSRVPICAGQRSTSADRAHADSAGAPRRRRSARWREALQ